MVVFDNSLMSILNCLIIKAGIANLKVFRAGAAYVSGEMSFEFQTEL